MVPLQDLMETFVNALVLQDIPEFIVKSTIHVKLTLVKTEQLRNQTVTFVNAYAQLDTQESIVQSLIHV